MYCRYSTSQYDRQSFVGNLVKIPPWKWFMSRPTWQTCKRWTCYVIGVKATRVEVLINCRNTIYLAAKALNCQQTSDNLVLFCRNVQIPQTHCRKTLQKNMKVCDCSWIVSQGRYLCWYCSHWEVSWVWFT